MNVTIPWTDLLAIIIAIISLGVSLINLYFYYQSHRRAYQQEKRQQPNLLLEHIDSWVRKEKSSRTYAFRLSVKNPTDSDNAISSVDLCLTYLTPSNTQMTVKLLPYKMCVAELLNKPVV